jgi:anti-anti-sigma factor
VIRATPFEIHTELEGETARVTLSGELDLATVSRVEDAIGTMLSRGARDVIVDLTRLGFVDSSGLRLFIALNDRATEEGWTLGLVRPNESSLSVFQITGAEQNLPFIQDPGS